MSADLLAAPSAVAVTRSSPPSKRRKVEQETCGLEKQEGNGIHLKQESNGNGMAHAGNGVNGTQNGGGAEGGIDEGLYSRQLFVLGKWWRKDSMRWKQIMGFFFTFRTV